MATASSESRESRVESRGPEPQQPGQLEQAISETVRNAHAMRDGAAQFLGVPPKHVCALLRNVWKTSEGQPPLTDQEMLMGMSLIARYGLDPMAKEIYVTRDKRGRLMNIVGIDGFIKILDRTDHYDGYTQEEITDDKGRVIAIVTTIYSTKRSHPTVYKGRREEYEKMGGFVAGAMPIHMLGLFSLRHAARRFTPIGGSVVTEDEARWMTAYDRAEEQIALRPAGSRQDQLAERLRRSDAALAEKMAAEGQESNPQSPIPNPHSAVEQAAAAEVAAGPNGTGQESRVENQGPEVSAAESQVPAASEEEQLVEEFRVEIGKAVEKGDMTRLNELERMASENPGLSQRGKQRVIDPCGQGREAIKGSRRPRSNKGQQQKAF